MVFVLALPKGAFDRSCAGRKPGCKRTQERWQLAVQEGKQIEALEVASSQFRK